MATLKRFNPTTQEWEYVASGPQGVPGPAIEVATFTASGDVATFTGTSRYYLDMAGTVKVARASLGTAGSTTTTAVVKKNGTIIATVSLGSTVNTLAVQPEVSVSTGDFLTVDVTAAGTGAKDLVVTVRVEG